MGEIKLLPREYQKALESDFSEGIPQLFYILTAKEGRLCFLSVCMYLCVFLWYKTPVVSHTENPPDPRGTHQYWL